MVGLKNYIKSRGDLYQEKSKEYSRSKLYSLSKKQVSRRNEEIRQGTEEIWDKKEKEDDRREKKDLIKRMMCFKNITDDHYEFNSRVKCGLAFDRFEM